MSDDPSHLVERVASRLRGVGGLAAVEPAPERDIRNVVRRDAERRPFIRRPAAPTATPDAGADPAEDNDGAARPDPGEPRASGLDPAPLEADGPAPGTGGSAAAHVHRGDCGSVQNTTRSAAHGAAPPAIARPAIACTCARALVDTEPFHVRNN